MTKPDHIEQSDLLSAANAYSNEHGHDALKAVLRATLGVDRITDIAEEDRLVAYIALINGKMLALQKASQQRKPTIDSKTIYDRWNRRTTEDFDFG